MKIPIYQVDAFTSNVFGGNPAAVCPLGEWLSERLMQQIAMENNLSETAFLVKDGVDYHIRWFTPAVEVDLCGHATLASGHVLFNHLHFPGDTIHFHSKSGLLKVSHGSKGLLTLNFPAYIPTLVDEPPSSIAEGLGHRNAKVYKGPTDYLVVLDKQEDIEALEPDFRALAKTSSRGVVVTAKGDQSDFVSRCFFPQSGIDEDPVTGSAHCMMVPYWAQETGKTKLTAYQLSKRNGYLECELIKDRVYISGYAVTYMKGEIEI
jgi:PhzF family phenazine biosynthesis protein